MNTKTSNIKFTVAALLLGGNARTLLQPAVRANLAPEVLDKMTGALADSLAYVFQWSVILPVISFLIVLLMMGKARVEIVKKPS